MSLQGLVIVAFIIILLGYVYKSVFFPKKNEDRYERNKKANGKSGTKK
jgi:hypothetical protein